MNRHTDETQPDTPHRIIRASAGTGKTYTLSGQYVSLLNRQVKPSQILVTTFTRKAAGQILGRILLRLAEAGLDSKAAKRLGGEIGDGTFNPKRGGELLEQLARSIHRLNIGTLDSFFYSIVRMFRLELGLPGQVRIMEPDDPTARAIRTEAIGLMLGGQKRDVLMHLMQRLFHGATNRGISWKIDQWVVETGRLFIEAPQEEYWTRYPSEPEQFETTIEQLKHAIESQASNVDDGRLAKALNKLAERVEQGDWVALMDDGLMKKAGAGDWTYHRKPLPKPIVESLGDLHDLVARYELAGVGRRVHAMWELLGWTQAQIDRLHLGRGVLEFEDLLRLLAERWTGLEHRLDDLSYRLDSRIRHLLLDEFQDTSVPQWRVLAPIAEEITSGESQGDPVPRTLFAVGDMKQAIYGWRGGCAAIFDHLESSLHLPASVRESLVKCFRCSPVVLSAVDALFKDLPENAGIREASLPLFEAWSKAFEPHQAADEHQPGYVHLCTSPVVDEEETSGESGGPEVQGGGSEEVDDHLEFAAGYIAKLAAAHPYRSIGVLVNRNEMAKDLIVALRRRDIAASGESGSSVGDDPAVQLVLSVFRLAEHPGDTASAWLLMRSAMADWVGLEAAPGRSLPGRRRIESVSRRLRDRIGRQGAAEVAADFIIELRKRCEPRSLTRLDQVLTMIERYSARGDTRLMQLVEYLENAAVEEGSAAMLRVMTIHKAKGLEFDIVVLPELQRKITYMSQVGLLADRPDPTGPIRGIYDASNAPLRAAFEPAERAYQQQLESRVRDSLCALYVAMTRARYALHMLIKPIMHTKTGISAIGWSDDSSAALLRRRFSTWAEDEPPDGDCVLWTLGDPNWDQSAGSSIDGLTAAPATLERIDPKSFRKSDNRRRRRGLDFLSPSRMEGKGRRTGGDLLAVSRGGMEYGTILHRWFEMIEFYDGPTSLPAREALLAEAARLGLGRSADELESMVEHFHACFESPAVQQAFGAPDGEHELWRERLFVVMLPGGSGGTGAGSRLVRGQFDRVVLERAGGRWHRATIMDFKTDRIGTRGVGPVVEHYRPQMQSYIDCVRRLAPSDSTQKLKIVARLLFTSTGELVDAHRDG
ncbi:MAG: UvrD-helicase domain-containing protein [Phycisphaeraceae bacterium]|nr:UvrD-helicase domain-containing protein [Phycisphaeraceae bacterium]